MAWVLATKQSTPIGFRRPSAAPGWCRHLVCAGHLHLQLAVAIEKPSPQRPAGIWPVMPASRNDLLEDGGGCGDPTHALFVGVMGGDDGVHRHQVDVLRQAK
jgi:hypothetical protein